MRNHNAPRRTNDSPIAQARLAKGWTQQQLAEALGVGQPMIAHWETGAKKPKMQTLMRIADALGVDWLTLIDK